MTATPSQTVRIATRSSPMAMAQAEHVARLVDQQGLPTEYVPLTTTGDRWTGDLATLGGKGAFVKEIDRALLDREADFAVHCLKDIPGDVPLPEGIAFGCYLPRESVSDCIVARPGVELPDGLGSLPSGAVVGTSSVRRQAQLRRRWPQLDLRPVRGNANSRLAKLDNGDFDALVLAEAGLHRIGRADRITALLPVNDLIPAVGAGQLVICVRADDETFVQLAAALGDEASETTARTERAMLAALEGHCNSPIAGNARLLPDGSLVLSGAVYSLHGDQMAEAFESGHADEPEKLGDLVAEQLLRRGARNLIAAAGT